METEWRPLVTELYQKIKPLSGSLNSGVSEGAARRGKFSNLWIWFELEPFSYVDPFYGEMEATDNFSMEIDLIDIEALEEMGQIHPLQHLELRPDPTNRIGAFSNSLHFTIPHLKFGAIEGQEIEFYMEYCLTNGDSYGYMTGTMEDHLQVTGQLKTKLSIAELIVTQYNDRPLSDVLKHLDKRVYHTANARVATDTGISMNDRTQYRVPYRDIVPSTMGWRRWLGWN